MEMCEWNITLNSKNDAEQNWNYFEEKWTLKTRISIKWEVSWTTKGKYVFNFVQQLWRNRITIKLLRDRPVHKKCFFL